MAARLDCQLAVWLSVAGRQADVDMGASHAIGHILGGTCNVPHGYTSCVMLPSGAALQPGRQPGAPSVWSPRRWGSRTATPPSWWPASSPALGLPAACRRSG
ncbi:MAG: iron-containing alcohol dehydrogenase [Pseudomonadota bacterium]